jgi:hypothetical protein
MVIAIDTRRTVPATIRALRQLSHNNRTSPDKTASQPESRLPAPLCGLVAISVQTLTNEPLEAPKISYLQILSRINRLRKKLLPYGSP